MGPLTALACALAVAGAPRQDPAGDAWARAQALPGGHERAAALCAAVAEPGLEPASLQPRLQAAWEEFQAAHDAFRGEDALALARSMFAAQPARWSVECLEGIARRLGDYEGADRVLGRFLATCEDPGDRTALLERRALLAAAAGWHERERDLLGQALARGGTDAYQMLARAALAAGEPDRARSLFRVLVERHPGPDAGSAPPWALRGWGLSLLPVR